MQTYSLETPVLIILFNPDTSRQVFECAKQQRPRYLYLFSDGPRAGNEKDVRNCETVRSFVNLIDWDCECKTYFSKDNLGPGLAVGTAINWFFENVEEGIVLEHDVIVHPDFFPYCSQLLERYRNNENVLVIHGSNNHEIAHGEDSYYFSRKQMIGWGFATWRRAWKGYDVHLNGFSVAALKKALKDCGFGWNDRKFQIDHFKLIKQRKANTWDWQMEFNFWMKRGFAVRSNVNMVKNIGFIPEAYNFKYGNFDKKLMTIELHPIMPLKHPKEIAVLPDVDVSYTPTLIVTLPILHKPVTVRKNFIWWAWRWFRRNFVAKKILR